MTYVRDTRSDAELNRLHERDTWRAGSEEELALKIRQHLQATGRPLTQVKTDAPLSLTGQWGGE